MTTTDKTKTRATMSGASLTADIDAGAPGVEVEAHYWIGAFPQCSGEGLHVGGIDFPKITEDVRTTSGGKTERIPRIGSVRQLTQAKLEILRERLPLNVIRFKEPAKEGQHDDALDYDQPRRHGGPIRIPSKQALKDAKDNGCLIRKYVRQKWDEPASRYIFAVLCTDQENPTRGQSYPEPLEVTGLEWPE